MHENWYLTQFDHAELKNEIRYSKFGPPEDQNGVKTPIMMTRIEKLRYSLLHIQVVS